MIAILGPFLSFTNCSVSNCLIMLSFREENTQFQMNKTDFFQSMALQDFNIHSNWIEQEGE